MKITIDDDINLGSSHFDSVSTIAQGEFEMPDEYVDTIVALIRECGTTDINELRFAELHPDIYEFLNENINKIYNLANEALFIRIGFAMGAWLEYDVNLIEYCEKELGFEYQKKDYINEFDLYSEEEYDVDYDDDVEEEYEIDFSDDEEEDDDYDDNNNNNVCEYCSYFECWLRNYVETLTDKELVDFFYEHVNHFFKPSLSKFEISIPQQIIDLAYGENNDEE